MSYLICLGRSVFWGSAELMVGIETLLDQQVHFCPVGLSLQPLNASSASSNQSPSSRHTKRIEAPTIIVLSWINSKPPLLEVLKGPNQPLEKIYSKALVALLLLSPFQVLQNKFLPNPCNHSLFWHPPRTYPNIRWIHRLDHCSPVREKTFGCKQQGTRNSQEFVSSQWKDSKTLCR